MPMTNEQAALQVESIICFESTAQAIMAEQALLEAAFNVRVMPKPAGIQAGCGFCLGGALGLQLVICNDSFAAVRYNGN